MHANEKLIISTSRPSVLLCAFSFSLTWNRSEPNLKGRCRRIRRPRCFICIPDILRPSMVKSIRFYCPGSRIQSLHLHFFFCLPASWGWKLMKALTKTWICPTFYFQNVNRRSAMNSLVCLFCFTLLKEIDEKAIIRLRSRIKADENFKCCPCNQENNVSCFFSLLQAHPCQYQFCRRCKGNAFQITTFSVIY